LHVFNKGESLVSKKQEEIVEYAPQNNKKTADPNTLVLDSETPIKQEPLSHHAFRWRDHKDLIVVQHQPAIAAYNEADGSICIRQEDIWGDGSDVTVYFSPEHAEKVANAILVLAKGTK